MERKVHGNLHGPGPLRYLVQFPRWAKKGEKKWAGGGSPLPLRPTAINSFATSCRLICTLYFLHSYSVLAPFHIDHLEVFCRPSLKRDCLQSWEYSQPEVAPENFLTRQNRMPA
jgi:hypothetical protein